MTGTSFQHGIASFDPTETSVLMWTRVERAGRVDWRVATDPAMALVVCAGDTVATDGSDGCIVVDVDGLDPGTTYFYDFETAGEHSPVGRTRTLPAGQAARLRLGITCCADFSAAPLGVYRALADREVDAVLHLGDYIYEAASDRSGRRATFAGPAMTLDGYRERYAQLRADPDVQHLHQRHPMITIWDDHDLADNAWRTGAKAHEPDEHGPWADRVEAATRARNEWLPIRHREAARPDRTWRSVTVGDLAEIVLLDTRYEGRDRQPGDEGTLPRDHPDRSLLGDDQRAWLGERLEDRSRPWTVIASGVVVNEISLPIPAAHRLPSGLLPNGYAMFDGELVHDDQWDGYVAERDLLTARIEQRAAHGAKTVIVSGDVHSCWAFEGPPGSDGSPVSVEAVCPAATSAAMGRANLPGGNRLLDRAVRKMSQVQWANVTERGYLICDLDRTRAQFEWWAIDPYSETPGETEDCIAVRALPHDRWPCTLDTVDEPTPDPDRTALDQELSRPPDLRNLRIKRFVRLWSKTVAVAAFVGGAVFARRSLR